MDDWTPERIAELPNIKSVKNLRENARKRGNNAVVVLCDADLAQRTPVRKRPRRVQVSFESRKHRVVVGFHFVCNTDNGGPRTIPAFGDFCPS
jgi:hypothetical protein